MSVASVHISDVGAPTAIRMLRGPGEVAGLRSADAAIAAPLRRGGFARPMPGRIALVAFWEDRAALQGFLQDDPYAGRLADGWRAQLEPLRAYGTWPGLPPDTARSRAVTDDGPVVVVTLGRLRIRRARQFLRTSRPAEASAVTAVGFRWGTALARPPFVSTVSLWESAAAAAAYAYTDGAEAHPGAIAADRRKAFHHRSAFIRFHPLEVHGALGGRNPLPEGLVSRIPQL
jgi:hypothetical protein